MKTKETKKAMSLREKAQLSGEVSEVLFKRTSDPLELKQILDSVVSLLTERKYHIVRKGEAI